MTGCEEDDEVLPPLGYGTKPGAEVDAAVELANGAELDRVVPALGYGTNPGLDVDCIVADEMELPPFG